MKRGLLIAASVVAIAVLSVGSAGASRSDGGCTWGASSITAQYVNGRLVESPPVTTGCTP